MRPKPTKIDEALPPEEVVGRIGDVWRDRPHRGTREFRIAQGAPPRLRVIERWDPSIPGYAKIVQSVPAWRVEVLQGFEYASSTHKERTGEAPLRGRKTHRVTVIRDDNLKRLFQRVGGNP